MCSRKRQIALISFIFISFLGFSQEEKKDAKEPAKQIMPVSIYTNFSQITTLNNAYYINEKLKLISFQTMLLNMQTLETQGTFNIPLYNINLSPTTYIINSYHQNFMNSNF